MEIHSDFLPKSTFLEQLVILLLGYDPMYPNHYTFIYWNIWWNGSTIDIFEVLGRKVEWQLLDNSIITVSG